MNFVSKNILLKEKLKSPWITFSKKRDHMHFFYDKSVGTIQGFNLLSESFSDFLYPDKTLMSVSTEKEFDEKCNLILDSISKGGEL